MSIRPKFKKSGINPTLYRYNIHKTEIRRDRELAKLIFGRMAEVTGRAPPERDEYNHLQIFAKSFVADSFYDLHVEPKARYGEFAYVIFLEDVREGGELVFPTLEEARALLKGRASEAQGWRENLEVMAAHGESVRWCGPLSVRPERNVAVLFRVGSPHFVRKIGGAPDGAISRRALTGWPFCTDELIASLNRNCQLGEKFANAVARAPQ